MSLKQKIAVGLTTAAVAIGSFAVPAMAQQGRSFDPARLDKAQAEYTQYRRYYGGYRGGYYRGYRGNGAAIAGAVGLGILGAAAIAANRRAYADPYYYDDGYYAPAPVYAPAPRAYYRGGYGYAPYGYYDFRNDR